MNTCSSFICDYPTLEITQITHRMKKQTMVQPYVGSYSAIKKNELLIPVTPSMNLKGIMPSKRSQSQKIASVVSFICHSEKRQNCRDTDQISGYQG